MTHKNIRKLVFSAMLAALVFTATWISVPNGLGGNINLGDSVLLLGAWLLGGPWATAAAAVGAALTDLLGGYTVYAPATLVIKAVMVLVAILVSHLLRRFPPFPRRLLSGLAAESVMVAGYFGYEAFVLGLGILPAATGIPFNLIQGAVSILIANLLCLILEKAGLSDVIKQ